LRSPENAAAPELLAVGVITSTHGIGGDLKVRTFSGEAGHLLGLRAAVLRKAAVERRVSFVQVRPQGGGVIVRVQGMDSPEKARALVGFEIWVPRAQAAPLALNEYYEADLCRCTVWFGDEEVGRVRSVWDGGPAQLLEIVGSGGKTFLVPFSAHFIRDVDVERRRIGLAVDEVIR
jgi:16S rRNA processing protein RimM